jgi:hypothetical protein
MSFQPFTPFEQRAIAEVLAHQHACISSSSNNSAAPILTELHIALDGNGSAEISRQIVPAKGGVMNLAMTNAAHSSVGCRIFHNHPSEHALSPSDWGVLANHTGMEMTAVNSSGTTFRGRVLVSSAFSNWATALNLVFSNVEAKFQNYISGLASKEAWAELDFATQNNWLVSKAVCDQLNSKGYVEFECILSGGNLSASSNNYFLKIRNILDQFCQAEIP